MGKYLSFQEVALALITKRGQQVPVTRTDASAFDPVTQSSVTSGTVETFAAVVMPPSKEAEYKARSLELSFSAEAYFALLGRSFVPGPGDTFVANGREYTIRHSQTYNPAGDGPIVTVAYAI